MKKEHIYLDHGASTPVHPEVMEAMRPYWTEEYGNPSSTHHYGQSARRGLERARQTIADLLNARPDEIIFTGCGSESDNMALRGVMWTARQGGRVRSGRRGNHLIISAIEHKAVSETARQLRDHFDFDLTILPVDENGQVDVGDMEAAIRPDTVLISIMAANNEIGTLQPVQAIGEIARSHGVLFHSDAIQAAAVTSWDMDAIPLDLASFAPHKFYGPKGIGFLYARHGIDLFPTLTGGSQEEGRRAGTSNVPYAVGAAEAFRLAMEQREENVAHYRRLRDRLIEGVLAGVPDGAILTGHAEKRLPHNASFAFRNVSGNDLLIQLDMAGIAASSGSACTTGNPKPSSVLEALGLDPAWTKGGLRLTVGHQNTMDDVEKAVEAIPRAIDALRALNPQTA